MQTRILLILLVVYQVLGFGACSSPGTSPKARLVRQPLSIESAKEFSPKKRNSLVVMPLEAGAGIAVPADHLQALSHSLTEAFDVETSLEILNSAEPAGVEKAISTVEKLPLSKQEKAKLVGTQLSTDMVLFGAVTRIDESDGGRFGASRPSAVSFRLSLYDTSLDKVAWTATFEQREQALTENLLELPQKLRRGVQFKEADELLRLGFRDAAKVLEASRSSAPPPANP